MASRLLSDLSPACRSKVVEMLAKLTEANIPVIIVETRRTQAEHEANIAAGKSWTQHSKHIDGNAIDVAPYLTFNIRGARIIQWDGNDGVYAKMGAIGESCGLKWGGRWTQRDNVHFELP